MTGEGFRALRFALWALRFLVLQCSLTCCSHAGYYTPIVGSDAESTELGEMIPVAMCSNCDEHPVALRALKCGFRDWCVVCDDSLWSTREDWPPFPSAINFDHAVQEDSGTSTTTLVQTQMRGSEHVHSLGCQRDRPPCKCGLPSLSHE